MHQNIPDTMPATWQDCFNYLVRYVGFTNSTIQAVIHFKGKLDVVRLARAVKLSVDAEPVLGCKFIEREDRPFWQRLTDQDNISWCALEEVSDREKAVKGLSVVDRKKTTIFGQASFPCLYGHVKPYGKFVWIRFC